MKNILRFISLVTLSIIAAPALALINPRVQPNHLFKQYERVVVATVEKVDSRGKTLSFAIDEVVKGELDAKSVTLTASEQAGLESVLAVSEGQQVVAFVGQAGRRGKDKILYYVGGGRWYQASIDNLNKPDTWTIVRNPDEGLDPGSESIMFGVFNGAIGQLAELVRDEAADRGYYPATPFTRFEDTTLAKLDGPIHGVGLHDLNADGRLDVIAAAGRAGVRVLLQDDQSGFIDATEKLGLADARTRSVSATDFDHDGDADLLLDAVIFAEHEGRFVKEDHHLPEMKGSIAAAFIELNGDGYPDVVVSRKGAGLAAFQNPGAAAAGRAVEGMASPWTDVTRRLGLDADEIARGTGYFEPTDWNADGKADLFYLAGPGYLLVRRDDGAFAIEALSDDEYAEWTTAAAGPIIAPGHESAFVVGGWQKMLLSSLREGVEQDPGIAIADVTRYGNEIQDDAPNLLMTLADDLNADGNIDLYAASQDDASPAMMATNRGYGSFMLPEKYAGGQVVPPAAYTAAAHGLAAGDVNADGANDLLIGRADGTLTLLINRTLVDRPDEVRPSHMQDERRRIQARMLTIVPTGPGSLGARIELHDTNQRLVASRRIGGNVGIGCAPPHQTTLAVRQPGRYHLAVRFAHGLQQVLEIDLCDGQPRHQRLQVKSPDPSPTATVPTVAQ